MQIHTTWANDIAPCCNLNSTLMQLAFNKSTLQDLSARVQLAEKVGDQRPVTILFGSQAAIARLQHTQPGPGQALMIQVHAIAKRLHARGRQPTIQWVPEQTGVEGNERADQVAEQAVSKPSGRGPKESSLAFACRARTEAVTTQKQRWLTKELG